MTDSTVSESPLEAAAGAAGPRAVDAFKLLSNETRLAILLALWEAADPLAEDDTVPFSTLFDRVSLRDSGTFAYHLDKLVGEYVEESVDGYRLRHAGRQIVQTVITGAGLDERTLSPTELDMSCRRCGAPVELSYDDEYLYLACTECTGNFTPEFRNTVDMEIPPGTLIVWNLNPAALATRTPGQVYAAGHIHSHMNVKSFVRGVCPECSGPVNEDLQLCENHETNEQGICEACGTPEEVRVRYTCQLCKFYGAYPLIAAVTEQSVVHAFYVDQGMDSLEHVEDPESCARVIDRRRESTQQLVSEDPLRIRVTIPGTDATLQLTLNEDLDVVDTAETDRGIA